MKIEKIKYGMRAFLLSMIFILTLLPDTAFARVPIDLNQKNSLTIHFPCDNIPIQIYRVADVTEAGEYIRTEAFSDYNILLEQPDQTGWRNLAATISGYAERDGIHRDPKASMYTSDLSRNRRRNASKEYRTSVRQFGAGWGREYT